MSQPGAPSECKLSIPLQTWEYPTLVRFMNTAVTWKIRLLIKSYYKHETSNGHLIETRSVFLSSV